jgi:tetratricopeptide (TPR) repeat protein
MVAAAGARPSLDFRQQRAIQQLQQLIATSAYDSALTFATSILENAAAEGDSLYLGAVMVERGRAELGLGDPARAFNTLTTAATISEAQRDTTSWMTSLGMQSLALAHLGRYDDGLARNRARLELAVAAGDPVSEAWARVGIAYDALVRGRYQVAKNEYELAAAGFRAAGATREELVCLIGLGRASDNLGDPAGARDTYTLARDRARELGDRENEADALNNLGVIEYHHGDMATAAAHFEEAWRIRVATSGAMRAVPMGSNVALVYAELGQYETAAALLTEAIDAVAELGATAGARALSIELANIRQLQGRNHAAVRLYREALARPDELTNESATEGAVGLSTALAAMDSLEASIAAIEVLRTQRGAEGMASTHAGADRMLASMHRKLGRFETALTYARRAEAATREGQWQVRGPVLFELSRCLALSGNNAAAHRRFTEGVAMMAQQRTATADFTWREAMGSRRYVALIDAAGILLEHPPELTASQRREALFDTLQRFKSRTLLDRVSAPRDTTQASRHRLEPVTLSRLQEEILTPADVFLGFSVGNENSFMFAVTRDSCRVLQLPGRGSSFPARAALFSQAVGTRPGGRSELAGADNAGRVLGDLILGGVMDLFQGAARLIVVPDAFLSAVPFGALAPGDMKLIDQFQIVQAPTPGVLGSGIVSGPPSESGIAVITEAPGGDTFGEVRSLEAKFDGVAVVSGRDGAMSLLESEDGIVHVAAHIEINDERPWRSRIRLASAPAGVDRSAGAIPSGAEAGETPPDILASEILGLDIRSPLAVLAGCESGLGRLTHGEGVQGLTAAFLVAGVPTVVASLWRVDDDATRTLMEHFYRHLSTGQSVVESLRQSQLDVRAAERTRHPYYWAGFIVVGDADTVIGLRERGAFARHGAQLLIIVAVALLAALILGGRRNSRKPV